MNKVNRGGELLVFLSLPFLSVSLLFLPPSLSAPFKISKPMHPKNITYRFRRLFCFKFDIVIELLCVAGCILVLFLPPL